MQQFTVPQFIEVEPKVIGPISVRQFIMLLIGALIVFIEYKLTDFTLFVLEGLLTAAIVCMFAFVKINGRQFHMFLLSFVQSWLRPKTRLWSKGEYWRDALHEVTAVATPVDPVLQANVATKQRQAGHLAELALQVDTGGEYREREK